jgi:hypothetical protein
MTRLLLQGFIGVRAPATGPRRAGPFDPARYFATLRDGSLRAEAKAGAAHPYAMPHGDARGEAKPLGLNI